MEMGIAHSIPTIGLYMHKNDKRLWDNAIIAVGTWTLWICYTQKVTLMFSLKIDT